MAPGAGRARRQSRAAADDQNGRFRPAIVILLLAISFAAFALPFRIGTPPAPPEDRSRVDGPRPTLPYPEAARLDLAAAHARFAAKAAVFVDVRERAEYEGGHIPGAISMPVAEVEARQQELAGAKEILTYCT